MKSPDGVIIDDIIATTTDGTVMGISIIDEQLWRRLSWLQRLCEWSEDLSPHSFRFPKYTSNDQFYMREERALPIGLGVASKDEIVMRTIQSRRERDMHIDGDVLARLLQRDGAEKLRRVIQHLSTKDDNSGMWMKAHIEQELGAVDGLLAALRQLLEARI